jgi:DNA polymerase zeta
VNRYIVTLAKSLNHALAISLKRNPHASKARFVRGILLVKGVHFYGFHSSYSPFLKIFMIDPVMVNRAATIMQSGTIMQTRFRVFESHLGFILQFLCDFGLYGCGWLDLDEVWQRGREDVNSDEEDNNLQFKPSQYFRESRMALEVDVPSHQILNRHLLSARNTHHELRVPAPPTSDVPLVLSVRELWEDERSRRVANGLPPSPELPLDPSESSRGIGGGWDAEAMWWDRLRARIEKERAHDIVPTEGDEGWEGWVMTTFESVEALWDDSWRVWRLSAGDVSARRGEKNGLEENPFGTASGSLSRLKTNDVTENDADVEIDETMLLSQEMDQFEEQDEINWDKFEDRNFSDEDANEDVLLHEGELPGQNGAIPGSQDMPSLSQNRDVNKYVSNTQYISTTLLTLSNL